MTITSMMDEQDRNDEAAIFAAVHGCTAADGVPAGFDAQLRALREELCVPPSAQARWNHVAAMRRERAGARKRRVRSFAVVLAASVGVVGLTTGLAAAGRLPGPAQHQVARLAEVVGVDLPGYDHAGDTSPRVTPSPLTSTIPPGSAADPPTALVGPVGPAGPRPVDDVRNVDAPGRSGDAPGQTGNTPGQSGNTPRPSGAGAGDPSTGPGNSASAPGHTDRQSTSPGNSANAPGHTSSAPGHSGEDPGKSASAPGHDSNGPGQSELHPPNGKATGQTGEPVEG
jgi:hypothetical protein